MKVTYDDQVNITIKVLTKTMNDYVSAGNTFAAYVVQNIINKVKEQSNECK